MQRGIQKVVTEAKLREPVEISALRKSDVGSGGYFVCLREMNPPPNERRRTYSVFFDADYKGSRESVILEKCELQEYALMELKVEQSGRKVAGARR
ncbi:hypothetical protein ACVIWV_003077 [Bradyrhizobium diazoefficiens]|uniref:hypothetical protein n=1 Tax=Bradyrhizobium TaxID=374 RepID=UPI0007C781B6|nr:hypothetical protein [Bradyrhizobium diazoefficiens]MBR0865105.1 hypothetical protein [Bradyrhizobium diazoefficiens]MBR0889639.1 hypothetical protein [Bradyrhizobium diazoefficiens]MBR0921346.1 hypothetical protein [Bradyrhizobium diazoefficiens]